jgi:hypothetical protein
MKMTDDDGNDNWLVVLEVALQQAIQKTLGRDPVKQRQTFS